jgi:hypothetical protein
MSRGRQRNGGISITVKPEISNRGRRASGSPHNPTVVPSAGFSQQRNAVQLFGNRCSANRFSIPRLLQHGLNPERFAEVTPPDVSHIEHCELLRHSGQNTP